MILGCTSAKTIRELLKKVDSMPKGHTDLRVRCQAFVDPIFTGKFKTYGEELGCRKGRQDPQVVSYLGYQSFLKEEPSWVGSLVPYLAVLLAAANLFIQGWLSLEMDASAVKKLDVRQPSVTLHLVQSFFFFPALLSRHPHTWSLH